jgi:uncharacterized membrane protein
MTLLLAIPLLCGLAFPVVAWLLKRGMELSRDPWGVLMVSNAATALPFVFMMAAAMVLTPREATFSPALLPVPLPALLCGAFFFAGQIASYQSLAKGDISLAIPVQGVKVLLISLFALAFMGQSAGWNLWVAALLIPAALYFMREHLPGARETRRYRVTIALALTAAACFAALDTGVQAWATPAGFFHFGFWTFSFQAVLSAGLYFMPGRAGRLRYSRRAWIPLLAGSLAMATITYLVVWVIAASGRAAWVNVLFNSRVLWGAVLPLFLGRWLGAREALQTGARRILAGRLAGAGLMLVSIALAVLG